MFGEGDPFEASVAGLVTFAERGGFPEVYASFSVEHPGGWQLMEGVVSPAFKSELVLGPGSFIDFVASVDFPTNVSLGPIQLLAHPDHGGGGMRLTTRISRPAGLELLALPPTFQVRLDGGLQITDLPPSILTESRTRDFMVHMYRMHACTHCMARRCHVSIVSIPC